MPGGNAIRRAVGIIPANLPVKQEKIGKEIIAPGAAAPALVVKIIVGITITRALVRGQRILIALGAGDPAKTLTAGVLIIPMPPLASIILQI